MFFLYLRPWTDSRFSLELRGRECGYKKGWIFDNREDALAHAESVRKAWEDVQYLQLHEVF